MSRLLVFLHVPVKQRVLQAELSTALPSLSVTAVGRLGDFERGIADGQDAVLSAALVLASRGMRVTLQGYRTGEPDEAYSLVGVDVAPDPARVRTVGTLDVLGREGTTAFVHDLLGAAPAVERVTKVEDLLPLLQMQRAEAVLIPARFAPELATATQMKLVQRPLAKRVLLPGVSVLNGASGVAQAIASLPASLLTNLGVDAWR